jgi:YesN/AraC family two-component response regulator
MRREQRGFQMDTLAEMVALQGRQATCSLKVLIADDESLARTTLRSMLQDLRLPLEIVEDATNGEEMIALVQRHAPDIVFVDIKMPRLDGLEAIRQAKAFAPDARWLIITGFSEFTYAQAALRIGVTDYLLKPIDPEEIGKVISEVLREQKKRLLVLNQHFERDFAALYHGLMSIKQENPDSLLIKGHFLAAVFYLDSYLAEAEKAKQQNDFIQDVQCALHHILLEKIRLALFSLPSGEIALIGAWRPEHEMHAEPLFRHCLQAVADILPRYQNDAFCVTMLQAAICHSYDELYERLTWLQEFSALRSVYGIGRKIHISDLSQFAAQPHFVVISALLEKLNHYYREKIYVQYMQAVDSLAACMSGDRVIDHGTIKSMSRFLCHTLPCEVTPEQSGDEWQRILQACGDQGLLTQPKRDQRDVVAQVILFVEQNYQSDISITEVADKLQVTPNYLSALFHRKVGVTFVKYLTKVRLLKAKEMLADPDMRVQRVAELVGYTSTRHFTKLFTSHFGYYPSEQRKMVNGSSVSVS